jgi:signal peptidase
VKVSHNVKAAHLTSKTRTSPPSLILLSGDLLSRGLGVRFRAPGTSMHPTIRHGDVITIEPVAPDNLKRGDIILYRSKSGFVAHRIMNMEERDGSRLTFCLRGDASTTCDAPVKPEQVLGKVVCLEREHRIIDPYSLRVRIWSMLYRWLARLKRSVSEWFSPRSGPRALGTKSENVELGMRNS